MASRPTRALLLVFAATALAVACSGGASAPSISVVVPNAARNTAAVPIALTGKNFYRKIVPDASNPGSSTKSDLRVVLASATTSVTLVLDSAVTPTSISATVPAGIQLGVYDVHVFADGGEGVLAAGYIASGPPASIAISSATEAAPGDSDIVTLSLQVKDAAGNPTSPDTSTIVASIVFSPALVSAVVPAPVSIAVGSTGTTVDITDTRVEAFGVGATLSDASLVVSTGSAAFIVGPPHTGRVLDGSTVGTTTVNTFFVIEDLDRNLVAVHSTTYRATFSPTQVGAGSCGGGSPSFSPTSVNVTNGAASFPVRADCAVVVGTIVYDVSPIISPAGALVESSGRITFQ